MGWPARRPKSSNHNERGSLLKQTRQQNRERVDDGSTGPQIDEERTLRTLAAGSEFEIVRRWYELEALERELGWNFRVRVTGMFIVGTGAWSHSR
jgi:hypothetical protein